MIYKVVETSIYKIGAIQIQDQKGGRIQIEFPHVILNVQRCWWIKCQVALHTFHALQHVQNTMNVSSPSLGD